MKKNLDYDIEREISNARERISEDDYSSSNLCFTAVIETKRESYLELFSTCMKLILDINDKKFNSELVLGIIIKAYQNNSWKKKDWSWYGEHSFKRAAELRKASPEDFEVLPLNSFMRNMLIDLQRTTDFWEVEFCAIHEPANNSLSFSTLTSCSHGMGVEFQTTQENIGKLIKPKIKKLALQEDVDIHFGLAAREVAKFVIVKNMA